MKQITITCLVCGRAAIATDAQLDTQSAYCCPACGASMSRSQWRQIRAAYFFATNLEDEVAAKMNGGTHCELKLFESKFFFDSDEAESQYFPELK